MFGNSPDETAYFRISLMREAVPDALMAIQPSLLAYALDQPVQVIPRPHRLDPEYSALRPTTLPSCLCAGSACAGQLRVMFHCERHLTQGNKHGAVSA